MAGAGGDSGVTWPTDTNHCVVDAGFVSLWCIKYSERPVVGSRGPTTGRLWVSEPPRAGQGVLLRGLAGARPLITVASTTF